MTITNTRITELLGIKYPIIQGGMAWIAESTLASAVTNAGGLGLIAGGSAPIDYLRDQIRKTKAAVNGKPFGVNIMLSSCCNNRCGKPRKIHGSMEGSRNQGYPGYSVGRTGQKNGKGWG